MIIKLILKIMVRLNFAAKRSFALKSWLILTLNHGQSWFPFETPPKVETEREKF